MPADKYDEQPGSGDVSIRLHLRLMLLRLKVEQDRVSEPREQVSPLASVKWLEAQYPKLLQALPFAVYATDAIGRITFYNEAATALWRRRPILGSDRWCGSWRIYSPDGRHLPHDKCPMAVAIRENRSVRGVGALAERPDGTRVAFMPFPTPLRDENAGLVGAVNVLIEISPDAL